MTRFGKILSFWQDFKSIWQDFKSIGQNFKSIWQTVKSIWQDFKSIGQDYMLIIFGDILGILLIFLDLCTVLIVPN